MRRREAPGGPGRSVAVLVLVLVLAGCGAAPRPDPVPPSSSLPSAVASVPADGLPLRTFGYSFGPLDAFSLPRETVLVTSVDQADNVTAVLARPSAPEVADYLRRALPLAGFTVTGDDPAGSALTFTGQGWSGSFTGASGSSAVLLRPAPLR